MLLIRRKGNPANGERLFSVLYTKRIKPFIILPNPVQPPNMESRKPAATAEPMTPATFGPIACMSR